MIQNDKPDSPSPPLWLGELSFSWYQIKLLRLGELTQNQLHLQWGLLTYLIFLKPQDSAVEEKQGGAPQQQQQQACFDWWTCRLYLLNLVSLTAEHLRLISVQPAQPKSPLLLLLLFKGSPPPPPKKERQQAYPQMFPFAFHSHED